ncbi:T9SS type A sorting domain-containing protein [Paraflavitalea pollutisoli]|uniref:T9SS type A sorting domain-containing protein n=1 Tax=Paraflavitalea pollutisoli TaxID=3034143 RepID=UPI0023EC6547|nr:T9SS type A sorting domain-containing protein [Paraflavitalea sp. H1-2-19X]
MYPNSTYVDTPIVSWRDHVSRIVRICIACAIAFLVTTDVWAQCQPPSLTFRNPVRLTPLSTEKKIGAIYRFANVTTGVDCHIQIMDLKGGATLYDMDIIGNVMGYDDAWQPYVNALKGETWLDWKITFKKAGTSIDTALPCLSITAVDIDGGSGGLREFIVASTPGAYAVHPNTLLNVSFDGVNSKAVGPSYAVDRVDTAEKKYMFQMNFSDVSTIYYRNGSQDKTNNPTDTRHTCIYFKSFFESGLITLPMELVSFTGKTAAHVNTLNWSVADERNLKEYAIQRSYDGYSWEAVGKTAVTEGVRNYSFSDKGGNFSTAYYRLIQLGVNGGVGFSNIVRLTQGNKALTITMPTLVKNSIPIKLETVASETYRFTLYNSQGMVVSTNNFAAQAGYNALQVDLPVTRAAGLYVLAVRNAAGVVVERKRIVVQ